MCVCHFPTHSSCPPFMALSAVAAIAAAMTLLEQVLASVFGPREVDSRADMQQDKAIIKCEYAMAAFSTGVRAPAVRLTVRPRTHIPQQQHGSTCAA